MTSTEFIAQKLLLQQMIADHKAYADEWYKCHADLEGAPCCEADVAHIEKARRLAKKNAEHHIARKLHYENELRDLLQNAVFA